MAEKTGIAWTDSTFNPWIGCTKVSPACDHCYAEAMDRRHRWGGAEHWGPGVPRQRTGKANWRQPEVWNLKAGQLGKRWLVFCASLADVFDNDVPEQWRSDLFHLIIATPNLTWLLLTKRIGNAAKILPGWMPALKNNVWLGASVGNQEEADRDIPKLLATPAAKRFVSYEPALGPIDFLKWLQAPVSLNQRGLVHTPHSTKLDWVIIGGESAQGGAKARPFNIAWSRNTVQQCKAAGVAVFVKQLGSNVIDRNDSGFEGDGDDYWPTGTADKVEHNPFGYLDKYQGAPVRVRLSRAGADPAEWPEDLRVQEFPA